MDKDGYNNSPDALRAEYERGFVEGMSHQAKSSVDRAVNAMSKREWAKLIRGVRVEGMTVFVTAKGGNDGARELCKALIEEMNHG
jgi:hypothetical protein